MHYFIDVEASRTSTTLHLTQSRYVTNLLNQFGMSASKPVQTPLAPNLKLSHTDGDLLDDLTDYRCMAGSLQYLTFTRPDIAHAVSLVSQYMHSPRSFSSC